MKQEQASILVIDDELIVRRLVQSVLEGEGYRVFSASSGMQGLKTARQFQPDLVLLDIVLPDMDGYEVWRMIKESNDLSATPVIFITAREETRIHSENARMGYVVDYIPKPIISEILLARVRNLLELVQSRKVLLWKNRELERKVADRNRLTAVIEQSGRAVLIVDHEDIVVYVNPAFGRVTGYPDNEVLGQPIESVERPVLTDYGYRELLPLIDELGSFQAKQTAMRKDGTVYEEELSVFSVDGGENCGRSIVVIKRDVTEQLRLESIAQAANLMDNVGFVFSGIRHELGNPLNSLKMTISVLRKKIDEFPRETITDFLNRSANEVSRIEYLLNALRSFSLYDKGNIVDVDLNAFLSRFVKLHEEDLTQKAISVKMQLPDHQITIRGDERALHQVLLNLLTNAVYALEERKKPSLSFSLYQRAPNLICLAVGDNGRGISESDREMLFKPFFTTRANGTGLGLVIVQKMLAAMSCSIEVDSKLGEGTVFNLLMPCLTEEVGSQ